MLPKYNYAKVVGLDFDGNPMVTVTFSECEDVRDGDLIEKVKDIFQMTSYSWEVERLEDISPNVTPHNWKKS